MVFFIYWAYSSPPEALKNTQKCLGFGKCRSSQKTADSCGEPQKPREPAEMKEQHKHKLLGPDFPRTFLTLTPGCPASGVKKFLPTGTAGNAVLGADVRDSRRRRPWPDRLTKNVLQKKVCVDFSAPELTVREPPHPHKMRKLRPKLRPRRIWTARIQK